MAKVDTRHTLAIANEKGGTAKTSTAVSVAAALAERGHGVLLVDLDPAGAASAWLGHRTDGAALRQVLDGEGKLSPVETSAQDLDLIPAGRALVGIGRNPEPGAELVLRAALEALVGPWRYVIADCAPGIGLLSVAALATADRVLVPVETSALGLEGPATLERTVSLVRDRLNPELEPERYVLVKVDRRTRLSGDVAAHVRELYGRRVCRTEIRTCTKLAEAPSFGQPITAYAPSSRSAEDYRALAAEVEKWQPL